MFILLNRVIQRLAFLEAKATTVGRRTTGRPCCHLVVRRRKASTSGWAASSVLLCYPRRTPPPPASQDGAFFHLYTHGTDQGWFSKLLKDEKDLALRGLKVEEGSPTERQQAVCKSRRDAGCPGPGALSEAGPPGRALPCQNQGEGTWSGQFRSANTHGSVWGGRGERRAAREL